MNGWKCSSVSTCGGTLWHSYSIFCCSGAWHSSQLTEMECHGLEFSAYSSWNKAPDRTGW